MPGDNLKLNESVHVEQTKTPTEQLRTLIVDAVDTSPPKQVPFLKEATALSKELGEFLTSGGLGNGVADLRYWLAAAMNRGYLKGVEDGRKEAQSGQDATTGNI